MQRDIRSRCGLLETKRTAYNLVSYYTALGHDANRDKNPADAQMYWQHADHYVRQVAIEKKERR